MGLVGHSYGAAGVSYIAQWDPRVGAVVALDNLGGPGPTSGNVPGTKGGSLGEQPCPADPADRTVVPITKPALGISADYGLPPTPNTSLPDPTAKEAESKVYSKAGVDSGEIVVRGGSHLDFSFIPNQAFGASLRGPDITDWYTTAWFDKYLRHDPGADAQLLSERWRDDPVEAGVDPGHDGNAFSFYYYSRLDVHLAGGSVFDCEDLRDGCAGMTADDGYRGSYSYFSIDTTPDAVHGPGATLALASRLTPCTSAQRITIRLHRFHRLRDHQGQGLRRSPAGAYGPRPIAALGHDLRPARRRPPHGARLPSTRKGRATRIVKRVYGCAHRARSTRASPRWSVRSRRGSAGARRRCRIGARRGA